MFRGEQDTVCNSGFRTSHNRVILVAVRCLSEHTAQFAPISSITPEMLLPSTADTLSTMNGNLLYKVRSTTTLTFLTRFKRLIVYFSPQSSPVVSDSAHKNLSTMQETGTVTYTTKVLPAQPEPTEEKCQLKHCVCVCVCV